MRLTRCCCVALLYSGGWWRVSSTHHLMHLQTDDLICFYNATTAASCGHRHKSGQLKAWILLPCTQSQSPEQQAHGAGRWGL